MLGFRLLVLYIKWSIHFGIWSAPVCIGMPALLPTDFLFGWSSYFLKDHICCENEMISVDWEWCIVLVHSWEDFIIKTSNLLLVLLWKHWHCSRNRVLLFSIKMERTNKWLECNTYMAASKFAGNSMAYFMKENSHELKRQ